MSFDQNKRYPRQKNIYTITVVNKSHGYVAHIETHSNKKQAEERLARVQELWVTSQQDSHFFVDSHVTPLERKTRWN